jgi:signal transduction histidine kinase
MLLPLAQEKSVELVHDIEPGLPDVLADRERILQVFSNLIGNALKFTPADGRVTLRARREESGVVFSIADTGSGIEADNLPHIFDRFWQAQETRRAGAGLGLAIAKGIVDAHGGTIWAESVPGDGSSFFL